MQRRPPGRVAVKLPAMTSELLLALRQGIVDALPRAAALRRRLHAEPRLSGHEGDSRDLVMHELDWLDWTPVAGTGAFARLGPAGPSVGLRAELDALPVTEVTGVQWASSVPGVMHACGHDVHLAALWAVVTAARALDLPAGLVAILQPREEVTPPGAGDVVASGILKGEEIEAMIGVHMQPGVEPGIVSTGAGAVNAAYDSFEIDVMGSPGHGAYPHLAVDPITTLAAIIGEVSSITARLVNPTHPTVVSFGRVSAGTADNVIPDRATCGGTIRTFRESDRSLLHRAIRETAEAIASGRGAGAAVRFTRGGPALVNDPGLVRRADHHMASLGLTVAELPFRSCGSDDFAEYGAAAASMMCFIGTGRINGVGLHHGAYLPDRDALELAALAFACGYAAGVEALQGGPVSRSASTR